MSHMGVTGICLAMIATGNFSEAWLYVAAPLVGGIVAALVHVGLGRLAAPSQPAPEAAE